ncbi:unnamed protein product [Phytophthora lilii]|uniref:Unnamed protein product n=1 Tax=Phytophthora lilii TaxID=2077276 RepID=A0A9W6WT81_9STRA|nr:unnamed protein product [Phytophthora lilii]
MVGLASTGSLEHLQQLYQLFPPLQEDHIIWKETWGGALQSACEYDNLSALRWLMEHPLGRGVDKNNVALGHCYHIAIAKSHVRVMKYLNETTHLIVAWLTNTSIRHGNSESLRWCVDHDLVNDQEAFSSIIDYAALNGRLDILQFF